jgi:hypothetical protein
LGDRGVVGNGWRGRVKSSHYRSAIVGRLLSLGLGYRGSLPREGEAEEEDGADELNSNVLDGVCLAGDLSGRIVKRVMVS